MAATKSLFLATALSSMALASCGPKTTTTTTTTTTNNNSGNEGGAHTTRAVPPGLEFMRLRHFLQEPNRLNSAECPANVTQAIDQFYKKGGRAFHFGPVCTNTVSGEQAAIVVTGTPEEASDIWVLINPADNAGRAMRVRRTPVSTKFTRAAVRNGWAYLMGETIANGDAEVPAGQTVLATFRIPKKDETATPEVLDLSVEELALLNTTDDATLTTAATALTSLAPPAERDAMTLLGTLSATNPASLISALPASGDVPVYSSLETGVYFKKGVINATSQPTNQLVAEVLEMVKGFEDRTNCAIGDHCLRKPGAPIPEPVDSGVSGQLLLRKDGDKVVIAAVVLSPGTNPPAVPHGTLGPVVEDNADDKTLAQSLTLDGELEGKVVSVTRLGWKFIAFAATKGSYHASSVFYQVANRAPRRLEDNGFYGLTTGTLSVGLRDVDARNGEPELVTLGHIGDNDVFAVSSFALPVYLTDRGSTPRLDVERLVISAHTVAEFDTALGRTYSAPSWETDREMCGFLNSSNAHAPTPVSRITPGTWFSVEYQTPGQPLRGTVASLTGPDLASADLAKLLGPFKDTPCEQLLCNPRLGYCYKLEDGKERGYIFFVKSGRDVKLWGISVLK